MTYNQWIKQKTIADKDIPVERKSEPRFRYPIGKVIHIDNREQFDRFARVGM